MLKYNRPDSCDDTEPNHEGMSNGGHCLEGRHPEISREGQNNRGGSYDVTCDGVSCDSMKDHNEKDNSTGIVCDALCREFNADSPLSDGVSVIDTLTTNKDIAADNSTNSAELASGTKGSVQSVMDKGKHTGESVSCKLRTGGDTFCGDLVSTGIGGIDNAITVDEAVIDNPTNVDEVVIDNPTNVDEAVIDTPITIDESVIDTSTTVDESFIYPLKISEKEAVATSSKSEGFTKCSNGVLIDTNKKPTERIIDTSTEDVVVDEDTNLVLSSTYTGHSPTLTTAAPPPTGHHITTSDCNPAIVKIGNGGGNTKVTLPSDPVHQCERHDSPSDSVTSSVPEQSLDSTQLSGNHSVDGSMSDLTAPVAVKSASISHAHGGGVGYQGEGRSHEDSSHGRLGSADKVSAGMISGKSGKSTRVPSYMKPTLSQQRKSIRLPVTSPSTATGSARGITPRKNICKSTNKNSPVSRLQQETGYDGMFSQISSYSAPGISQLGDACQMGHDPGHVGSSVKRRENSLHKQSPVIRQSLNSKTKPSSTKTKETQICPKCKGYISEDEASLRRQTWPPPASASRSHPRSSSSTSSKSPSHRAVCISECSSTSRIRSGSFCSTLSSISDVDSEADPAEKGKSVEGQNRACGEGVKRRTRDKGCEGVRARNRGSYRMSRDGEVAEGRERQLFDEDEIGDDSNKPGFVAVTTLEDPQAVRAVAFHPTGHLYAVGANSKTLRICTFPNLAFLKEDHDTLPATVTFKRQKHHKGSIYCVAWSPLGDLIATGSNDKAIKLLRYDADNHTASGSDMELNFHDGTVRDVVFMQDQSSQSSLLISGGAGDCKVYVTDCQTGTAIRSMAGHSGHIYSLHTWGGCMFVSGAQDRTARVWDLRAPAAINVVPSPAPGSAFASVCVDPSGRLLASGHEDSSVMLWDVRGNRIVQSYKAHTSDVRSVRFSMNAYYLLSASYDNKVVLTDLHGDLMRPLPSVVVAEHKDKVIQCRWHPSQLAFLTTSADRSVKSWALPVV